MDILFIPQQLHRIYSVRVEVRPPGAADTTVLQYNVTVRYLMPLPAGAHLVQIERSDARVGDALAADSAATELAQACGSAPYPLQLAINAAGRIAGIHNSQEIEKRWQATAAYLRQYFTGELAHDYILATERTLLNREKLKEALSADLFLGVYFSAQYRLGPPGPHRLRVAYPALPAVRPLVYTVEAMVEQESDTAKIGIQCTGTLDAAQPVQHLFEGGNKQPRVGRGTMRLRYELDSRSGLLHSAEGFWQTWLDSGRHDAGIRIKLLEDAGGQPQQVARKSFLSF